MSNWATKPPLGAVLNHGHPLSTGIMGAWLMHGGAGALGRIVDLSGNSNHGTLVADTHSVPGKFGPALDFDGTGDYVNIGDVESLDFGTNDFTVSLWIKTVGLTAGRLVNKRVGTLGWEVYTSANTHVDIFIGDAGGFEFGKVSTKPMNDDNWHHVVIVFDRDANAIAYTDGVSDGVKDISARTGTISNNAAATIGQYAASSFFNGFIDHVLIYNRALTASEIMSLYLDPFQMFRRQPIGLWVGSTSVGVPAGDAGIMTLNTGYWGATYND